MGRGKISDICLFFFQYNFLFFTDILTFDTPFPSFMCWFMASLNHLKLGLVDSIVDINIRTYTINYRRGPLKVLWSTRYFPACLLPNTSYYSSVVNIRVLLIAQPFTVFMSSSGSLRDYGRIGRKEKTFH